MPPHILQPCSEGAQFDMQYEVLQLHDRLT